MSCEVYEYIPFLSYIFNRRAQRLLNKQFVNNLVCCSICSDCKTVFKNYSSVTKHEKLFVVIIVTTKGLLKCYQLSQ